MKAPLLLVASAFTAGVGVGLHLAPPPWLAWGALALLAVSAVALWRRALWAATLGLLVVVALAGWVRAGLAVLPPGPGHLLYHRADGLVTIEGMVEDDPGRDGPRTRLRLAGSRLVREEGDQAVEGRVQVSLFGPAPPLAAGDRVRVSLRLARPLAFRNPGAFDYPGHLARNGIFLVGTGRGDAVRRLPEAPKPWPMRVRRWIHATVAAHLPPTSAALLEGLLLGERHRLPVTLVESFRRAGVFHILAISGFNVALLASAVFIGLRCLGLPPRPVAGLTIVLLGAFAVVVGGQASVIRATVMGILVLVARLIEREVVVWNSLAAATLGLLLWRPLDLADPGFQLTFAATTAILHLTRPFEAGLARWLPKRAAALMAVSLAAQLGVSPVMAVHFNQLSLVGVLANLIVVPLAGLITTLGVLTVLVALASSTVAHLLFQTLWLCLLALRLAVRGFTLLPFAVIHPPTPPLALVVGAFAGLGLLPLLGRGRAWRWAAALLAAGCLGLALVPWLAREPRLRILFFDVGQGDGTLITTPDGQALLVDTGGGGPGRSDRGERVIVPYLRRMGIGSLTALAVTHSDPDHAGGLGSLLRELRVGEVWESGAPEAVGGEMEALLGEAGVARRPLRRGERLRLGRLLVTVLNPPAGPLAAGSRGAAGEENDASLVLRLDWGAFSLLLTGDIEGSAEADLVASRLPLRALVLKVPHHGSRSSSTPAFVEAVGPRVAVIPVGASNPFGHPVPEVLARYAGEGTILYRTDRDGAIAVETDGETLWLRRWRDPGTVWRLDLGGRP